MRQWHLQWIYVTTGHYTMNTRCYTVWQQLWRSIAIARGRRIGKHLRTQSFQFFFGLLAAGAKLLSHFFVAIVQKSLRLFVQIFGRIAHRKVGQCLIQMSVRNAARVMKKKQQQQKLSYFKSIPPADASDGWHSVSAIVCSTRATFALLVAWQSLAFK